MEGVSKAHSEFATVSEREAENRWPWVLGTAAKMLVFYFEGVVVRGEVCNLVVIGVGRMIGWRVVTGEEGSK